MSSRVFVSLLALPLILFWIFSSTDAGHGDLCVADSNCTELDNNSTCRFSESCDSTTSCIGVCACVEGFAHVNGSCVKIRLGDPCASNTSCNSSVENSVCVNGTCDCGGEYVKKPENLCSLRRLGDECLKTEDCNATVKNSECHKRNRVCRCPPFFDQVDNNICKPVVGARCYSDEICMSIPNATCSKCPTSRSCVRKCLCLEGFKEVDRSCVKLKVGDDCVLFPGKNCSKTIFNSECRNGTCQCSGGYIERQDVCSLRVINDNCSKDEDCEAAVRNSFCNSSSSTCQCLQGYRSRSRNGSCQKIKIGDQCKSHQDCNTSVKNSRCIDNVCICLEQFFSNSDKTQCLKRLLGDPCEDEDSCANVQDSVCNQTCVCRPGFKPINNTRCTEREMDDPCGSHLDCAKACGGDVCACSSGKCSKAALEGTNCSTNYDCTELFNNSFCNNSTCHCNVNLAPDPAFQKCVFYNLGHGCSETQDRCEDSINNSVCFNKTCRCKDTHYPVNNSICSIKQIGGLKCESNTQCKVSYSSCQMGRCKCRVGYREKGFDACAPASLDDTCEKPEDCNTTIRHTDCDHGRCRCLPGYMLSNRTTTRPCERRTIGSRCKHSYDCSTVIENSVCVQCGPNTSDPQTCLTCQCNAGYYATTGNKCEARVLGYPCTNNSDCSVHVPNAVCLNKRCRCDGGYLSTGNRTFCQRKKIGDICDPGPNDDCNKTVDNSVCTPNGTKDICLCKSGYHYYQVDASKTLCRRRRIREQTCAVDQDCSDAVNMSHCASGVCVCDHGYATNLDRDACHKMRLHTDNCTTETECSTAVNNSTCVKGKCACVSGFYSHNNNTECLKRKINIGKCDVNVDVDCSAAVNHSECVDGLCRCRSGFMTRNDDPTTCHRRDIYDNCTQHTDCSNAVADTICRSRQCVCRLGFYASDDNTTCIKRKLGDKCSNNRDCQMAIGSSDCVNGTCVCIPDYDEHANSTQCVKAPNILGSKCTFDEQCSTRFQSSIGYSTCSHVNKTCVCPKGTFVSRDFMKCETLPQKIGDNCTDKTHCSGMANNTICQTGEMTWRCQCTPGYFPDNNRSTCHKWPEALGDVCIQHKQCSDKITFSLCEQGVCSCLYGYKKGDKDNLCIPKEKQILGHFDEPRPLHCSTTNPTPCSSWNNSICDMQAGLCRCKHRSALNSNKTCVSVQTYKITLNFTSIVLLSNDPYDYFPFNYSENYSNSSHPEYKNLAARITELGVKNMSMSSKHRDRYVSSEVISLDPSSNTGPGVLATVLLHLTPLAEDYTNVTKLIEITQMFTSSFQGKESELGKSLIKVKMPFNSAHVADYNECSSKERNDCDVNANCLNTLGSFMCVCKPMYDDMAEKHSIHTRGRVCKLPSDDRKQGSDVCSSDACTIKWEYVAWALTLFLLLILAFITYEIFQRKKDFSARKLYEKFGTTKIRKLRQASMRRLQESKRKKQEESKLKKEELKRKKEENKKKKEEEKKQKTEGKSTKVKKGKKKKDADVEEVEEIPEPGLVEIIYPPSIPFAGSDSVDVDITNLPGNMDITIDRQAVIEESSV